MANLYDRPVAGQFIDTYVPIPFEQIAQAGAKRQQRYDLASQGIEGVYDAAQALKYISGSEDERYVKESVIPRIQEIRDKYSKEDLSNPLIQRQMRKELESKVDKTLIRDIQDSQAAWVQDQKQKARLEAAGLYNPLIDESPDRGYSTARSGVYQYTTPSYRNPRPEMEQYFKDIEASDIAQLEDGRVKFGVVQSRVDDVVEEKWRDFGRTVAGQRELQIYKKMNPDWEERGETDSDIIRGMLQDVGDEFVWSRTGGQRYTGYSPGGQGSGRKPLTEASEAIAFDKEGLFDFKGAKTNEAGEVVLDIREDKFLNSALDWVAEPTPISVVDSLKGGRLSDLGQRAKDYAKGKIQELWTPSDRMKELGVPDAEQVWNGVEKATEAYVKTGKAMGKGLEFYRMFSDPTAVVNGLARSQGARFLQGVYLAKGEEKDQRIAKGIDLITEMYPSIAVDPDGRTRTNREVIDEYEAAMTAINHQSIDLDKLGNEKAREELENILRDKGVLNKTYMVMDGKGSSAPKLTGKDGVLDALGYDKEKGEDDFFEKVSELEGIGGFTRSGPEPGMYYIDVPDNKGRNRRVLVSSNDDFRALTRVSNEVIQGMRSGSPTVVRTGVPHRETGNELVYYTEPDIIDGQFEFKHSLGYIDAEEGTYTPLQMVTLDDIRSREWLQLQQSGYLGSDLTYTKKTEAQ